MLTVRVILHSYLRELLPPEAKGQATLALPEGACIRDVIRRLSIPEGAICALNDQLTSDRDMLLSDGDLLRFLRPGSGG